MPAYKTDRPLFILKIHCAYGCVVGANNETGPEMRLDGGNEKRVQTQVGFGRE